MARGGKRPGSGRKPGISNRPNILDYWTDEEVAEYFAYMRKSYKKSDRIATWVGDHISGKAVQAITGPNGGPIEVTTVAVSFKKGK